MSAAFERVPHSRAENFDERRPLKFFFSLENDMSTSTYFEFF